MYNFLKITFFWDVPCSLLQIDQHVSSAVKLYSSWGGISRLSTKEINLKFWSFIATSARSRHWELVSVRCIQWTHFFSVSLRSIRIIYSTRFSDWYLLFVFQTKMLDAFLIYPVLATRSSPFQFLLLIIVMFKFSLLRIVHSPYYFISYV